MSGADVDPTARVHSEARLGEGCVVGARCVIGPEVVMMNGSRCGDGTIVMGRVRIGEQCAIGAESVIGGARYELSASAFDCGIEIGDRSILRECVTINRGCPPGPGITRVGSDVYLGAGAHVGPDCRIGDHTVIEDEVHLLESVKIGIGCRVHEGTSVRGFIQIGDLADVGPNMVLGKDVPPYLRIEGAETPAFVGVNEKQLQARKMAPDLIEALGRAYRLLFESDKSWGEAVHELGTWDLEASEFLEFVDFVREIPG